MPGIEELVAGQLDADHVAVLADLMPGMFVIVRFRSRLLFARISAWLCVLASRRPSPRSCDRSWSLSVCIAGELVGRVAELRLRGRDLLFQQLNLLPRLGQQRLQLLIVAIERRGPLLILLRLLAIACCCSARA